MIHLVVREFPQDDVPWIFPISVAVPGACPSHQRPEDPEAGTDSTRRGSRFQRDPTTTRQFEVLPGAPEPWGIPINGGFLWGKIMENPNPKWISATLIDMGLTDSP